MSSPDSPRFAAFVKQVFGDNTELAEHFGRLMADAGTSRLRGEPQPAPFDIPNSSGRNDKVRQ